MGAVDGDVERGYFCRVQPGSGNEACRASQMTMYDVGRDIGQCILQTSAGEQVSGNFEYVNQLVHVIDDALATVAMIPAYDERNPVSLALLITGLGRGTLGTGKSA